MIVVLKGGAEQDKREQLINWLKNQGLGVHISEGEYQTVLGLIGDHFQKPFEEGAEIVTGSTHKTFFGPQRGVIGVNYKPEDLKWGLWETIETRAFPGSVSNHHLGTLHLIRRHQLAEKRSKMR